jgi:hypothetical protein
MADNSAPDTRTYFFDNPRNVNLILYGLFVCCAILLLLDFIVHRHLLHEWEKLLGFYSIYGFLACTAIVFGSKILRSLVERPEEYYDESPVSNGSGGEHVDK